MKRLLFLILILAMAALGACSSGSSSDGDGGTGGATERTVVGAVVDVNGQPVSGATVQAFDDSSSERVRGARAAGDPLADVLTGDNGEYEFDLPPGNYEIRITIDGFHAGTLYLTVEETNQEDEPVSAAPATLIEASVELNAQGTTSGMIVDATTGDPISGAALTVRAGIGNTSGEVVETGTTDAAGDFTFSLYTGVYTVEATKEGYAKATFPIIALGGEADIPGVTSGRTFSMSPSNLVDTDGLRIVLTWGAQPTDLDSHLLTPAIDGQKYHLFYGSAYMLDEGFDPVDVPFAAIDLDDTSSYGPETTTIVTPQDGTYTYYIHNYSAYEPDDADTETSIAASGAKVEVYDANGLIRTFYSPAGGNEVYWKVFTYNGATGVITTVNQLTNVNPGGGADWDEASDDYVTGMGYDDYSRSRKKVGK